MRLGKCAESCMSFLKCVMFHECALCWERGIFNAWYFETSLYSPMLLISAPKSVLCRALQTADISMHLLTPLNAPPPMFPLRVAGSLYRPRSGSAALIQHQGRPSRRQRTHLRTPDFLMCHYHIPTNSTKIVNLLFFELGSFCHCHTTFTQLPNPKQSDILPPPVPN